MSDMGKYMLYYLGLHTWEEVGFEIVLKKLSFLFL